jgi:hypothetical protein
MNKELYRLVSLAREACAGSKVQDIPIVLRLVEIAEDYITNHYPRSSLEFSFRAILKTVYKNLEDSTDYGDRLGPDQMLCDILNEMLKDK